MSNTYDADVTDDKQCEWLLGGLGKFTYHEEVAKAVFPISPDGYIATNEHVVKN